MGSKDTPNDSADATLAAWLATEAEVRARMDGNQGPGVATLAQVAGRTGLELMEAMLKGELPYPPIAETLDLSLVEVSSGRAVFQGRPGPRHLNPMGGIHGGWALTLIDSAGACAANSVLPPQTSCTTIETKGNFARPITTKTGTVRAEGRVVSQTRQIISTEIRVTNQEGKILAHGTSTVMVLGRRE